MTEIVWHETCGEHPRDPSCERAGCTEPPVAEAPPAKARRNGTKATPVPEAVVEATPMTEMPATSSHAWRASGILGQVDLVCQFLNNQSSGTPPTTDSPLEVVERQLQEWADQWHNDTDYCPSPSRVISHEDYLKIINVGKPALPFILRDLRDRGGDWYTALYVIAGYSPVPPEDEGDVERMDAAWLKWGHGHGYI